MAFSVAQLQLGLQALPEVRKYWVAYSGGLDSTVLLHAMHQIAGNVPLMAVHIHHGLHANANQWMQHCEEVCRQWGIAFHSELVAMQTNAGGSIEAMARAARYAALARFVGVDECLLTAQHRDDQAETLLLQLFRGAGPAGLAAMPALRCYADGWHARPLLPYTRTELQAYAKQHALVWREDDSNANTRFERNFLRHEVMPLLEKRWPALSEVLARSAGWQAESAALLFELADMDLPSEVTQAEGLPISTMSNLSSARQRNLLRYWIYRQNVPLPSSTQLQAIVNMLTLAPDRNPSVSWESYTVRRYRAVLYLLKPQTLPTPDEVYVWDLPHVLNLSALNMSLRMSDMPAALQQALHACRRVEVRFRQGGERIRLPGRAHRHRVKHLLQAAGVPPWLRARLPFIYGDGRLLAVLGLTPPLLAAETQEASNSPMPRAH